MITHTHTHTTSHNNARTQTRIYSRIWGYIYIYMLALRSSVYIVTEHGQGGSESNPSAKEIFRPSRLSFGPFQHSVKWVRCFSLGKVRPERAADHARHLMPRSCKGRALPLPILWATPDLNLFILPLPIIYIYKKAHAEEPHTNISSKM